MDVAAVARRARTENFPVASVLFPRRLRPHLRAVYGFARLVDMLGDELAGPPPEGGRGWTLQAHALSGGTGEARTFSKTTPSSRVAADRLTALDELEEEARPGTPASP